MCLHHLAALCKKVVAGLLLSPDPPCDPSRRSATRFSIQILYPVPPDVPPDPPCDPPCRSSMQVLPQSHYPDHLLLLVLLLLPPLCRSSGPVPLVTCRESAYTVALPLLGLLGVLRPRKLVPLPALWFEDLQFILIFIGMEFLDSFFMV